MLSAGGSNVGRTLKQSNETGVWTSELESAFVEALQVHPPMGKRRIQYLVPSGGPGPRSHNQGSRGFPTKSFGRYQLIQAYIYAKTGQTRTRKQISSHIQRFKNLNRDNPSALILVEAIPSSSASGSPAVFNHSFGPAEGSNSATTNESPVVVETLSPAEETAKPTFNPAPDQIHLNRLGSPSKQPNGLYRTSFIVPQLVQTVDEHSRVDKNLKTHYEEGNMHENMHLASPSTRAFGTSISNVSSVQSASHYMSQRCLASNIPLLQTNLPLSSHLLCAPMFSVPALSSSNQVVVYASMHNHNSTAMSPVTPVDQLLHTPPQPPEIPRQIRMKSDSRAHEHIADWLWPVADSSLDAIHTPFGLPNSLSPKTSVDNSLTLDHPAEPQQLSSPNHQLNNFSMANPLHPRLPRRLSYSQSHASTSSPLVFNNVSSALYPHSASRIIDPFYNENLASASPLDIKTSALKATHTHFDSTFSSMGSLSY